MRKNVDFLRTIVGDGSAGVTFGKMAPYDGTPIKDDLEIAGRLRGDVCKPDYDFLDPRLTLFYEEILKIIEVSGWTHRHHALSPELNFLWNEVAIVELLFPGVLGLTAYKERLREITRDSNAIFLQVIEDTSYMFSDGRPQTVVGAGASLAMRELPERTRRAIETPSFFATRTCCSRPCAERRAPQSDGTHSGRLSTRD